jgi:hypothetical protein
VFSYGRFPLFSRRFNHRHIMTGSVLLSDIAEDECTKLKIMIAHYVGRTHQREMMWATPQCAPDNLEASCLLKIGDVSRKLRLRCSCQFLWCASPEITNVSPAAVTFSKSTFIKSCCLPNMCVDTAIFYVILENSTTPSLGVRLRALGNGRCSVYWWSRYKDRCSAW